MPLKLRIRNLGYAYGRFFRPVDHRIAYTIHRRCIARHEKINEWFVNF